MKNIPALDQEERLEKVKRRAQEWLTWHICKGVVTGVAMEIAHTFKFELAIPLIPKGNFVQPAFIFFHTKRIF